MDQKVILEKGFMFCERCKIRFNKKENTIKEKTPEGTTRVLAECPECFKGHEIGRGAGARRFIRKNYDIVDE